jgi:hypothetical protein
MTARPINPQRAAYEPAVRHFLPGCEGDELLLRSSMMLLRDQATSRMRHCSDEAYGVLQQVQRLGQEQALASMPHDVLAQLRGVMLRLTAQAAALETVFGAGEQISIGKVAGGRG